MKAGVKATPLTAGVPVAVSGRIRSVLAGLAAVESVQKVLVAIPVASVLTTPVGRSPPVPDVRLKVTRTPATGVFRVGVRTITDGEPHTG